MTPAMISILLVWLLSDFVIRVLASPVTSARAKYGTAIAIETRINIKARTMRFDCAPKINR